jgi:hypothetical protein
MKNSLVHLKVPVPALLVLIFLSPNLGANVALAAADSLADAVRTTVSEQAKLTPSDGAPGDYFVIPCLFLKIVLLSARFAVMIMERDSGAAYVFVFDGMNWSQQAKLIVADNGPLISSASLSHLRVIALSRSPIPTPTTVIRVARPTFLRLMARLGRSRQS